MYSSVAVAESKVCCLRHTHFSLGTNILLSWSLYTTDISF